MISNIFTLTETENLHKASIHHVCWPGLLPHLYSVSQAINHIAGTNNNLQNACKLNIYKATQITCKEFACKVYFSYLCDKIINFRHKRKEDKDESSCRIKELIEGQ